MVIHGVADVLLQIDEMVRQNTGPNDVDLEHIDIGRARPQQLLVQGEARVRIKLSGNQGYRVAGILRPGSGPPLAKFHRFAGYRYGRGTGHLQSQCDHQKVQHECSVLSRAHDLLLNLTRQRSSRMRVRGWGLVSLRSADFCTFPSLCLRPDNSALQDQVTPTADSD